MGTLTLRRVSNMSNFCHQYSEQSLSKASHCFGAWWMFLQKSDKSAKVPAGEDTVLFSCGNYRYLEKQLMMRKIYYSLYDWSVISFEDTTDFISAWLVTMVNWSLWSVGFNIHRLFNQKYRKYTFLAIFTWVWRFLVKISHLVSDFHQILSGFPFLIWW